MPESRLAKAPHKYRLYRLNPTGLNWLHAQPYPDNGQSIALPGLVSVPMPDGRMLKLQLHEYLVMAKESAQSMQMRTYHVRSPEDPYVTGSVTISKDSLNLSISSASIRNHEGLLIQQASKFAQSSSSPDPHLYVTYWKDEYYAPGESGPDFSCYTR